MFGLIFGWAIPLNLNFSWKWCCMVKKKFKTNVNIKRKNVLHLKKYFSYLWTLIRHWSFSLCSCTFSTFPDMLYDAVCQWGGHTVHHLPLHSARSGAVASVWAVVTHGRRDASQAERWTCEHAQSTPCHGCPGSHAHLHVHRCGWRGRQDTFQLHL